MVPTETPGPGAPDLTHGHAHLFSLTRTHGIWQSWCQAPMQHARPACRVCSPQVTLSGDGSLTRRQEPATPTHGAAFLLGAQLVTQRLWPLSLRSEMSSLGKA